MLPWQPFLAFYICGAHLHHSKNTIEPSMCGGDAALCQITLSTCCPVVSSSSFFCLCFFPRLISAIAHWMSIILPHMVWP